MLLNDYLNKPIPIITESRNSSNIAILYPGFGYDLNSPLFFYLQLFLQYNNINILGYDYNYKRNDAFTKLTEEEQDTWLAYDFNQIGIHSKEYCKNYSKVVYIGKSLGTTMLLNQIKNNLVVKNAEYIWLTPGIMVNDIIEIIPKLNNKSLFIIGSADRLFDHKKVSSLKYPNITVKIIKDAGHFFENGNNYTKSIMNLSSVINHIKIFL